MTKQRLQDATYPSLRDVADQARVSAMTVSRALGNRPGIALETRKRILRIAIKLGYRPDPQITKLMHHIRSRHRARFRSVICGLTTFPSDTREPYHFDLINGARLRADELGHGFLVLQISSDPRTWGAIQRTLRSRGVEGVLLLPQKEPINLTPMLVWSNFAVVAASPTVIAPAVNRVLPDHFSNALLLCRQLATRGYRRIGLVINRAQDVRTKHVFDAAVIWHNLRESNTLLRPLLFADGAPDALREWFQHAQPDAIVCGNFQELDWVIRTLGLKVPGRIGLASMCTCGSMLREISGIDELPAVVGALAVDVLAAMLTRHECGLPASPSSTLVPGQWQEGRSSPSVKTVATKKRRREAAARHPLPSPGGTVFNIR